MSDSAEPAAEQPAENQNIEVPTNEPGTPIDSPRSILRLLVGGSLETTDLLRQWLEEGEARQRALLAENRPAAGETAGQQAVYVSLALLFASYEVTRRGLLIRAARLDGKPLTAGRVGFTLAPRLNALGRLRLAIRGVELLLAEDEATANAIARECEELNEQRQALDRGYLDEAMRRIDRLDLDATWGLVLDSADWHPGVIGIVASRVLERTGRPAMMIAVQDGVGKGSGRSISAFDLHAALAACGDLLVKHGGHRAAAGLTIEAGRIPAFAERFNAVARERLTPDDLVPRLRTDLELPLDEADEAACLAA